MKAEVVEPRTPTVICPGSDHGVVCIFHNNEHYYPGVCGHYRPEDQQRFARNYTAAEAEAIVKWLKERDGGYKVTAALAHLYAEGFFSRNRDARDAD